MGQQQPQGNTGGGQAPKGAGARGGGPFTLQNWYGGNPLQTAQDMSNRNLQQNLGQIRARYGASGLGNSSREAAAEGTAAGEAATGLGDVLASRGIGARQGDVGNMMNAIQMLGQYGAGLTGIGQQEQSIPALGAIMNMLSIFGPTYQSGAHQDRQASGFGFKA